jgi:hypothetical protein
VTPVTVSFVTETNGSRFSIEVDGHIEFFGGLLQELSMRMKVCVS